MPTKSIRRRAVEFITLSGSLFLLLELSVRIYLFGAAGLVPARINSVHGIPQSGVTQRSSESRLGIELAPNLDTYFKLAHFRTNARGLRDREYPLRKPENTFRVAVLGASFALPAGVEIEAAFHSLLEARSADSAMTKGALATRHEFINFAVGMYSPRQLLAMLELRALEYEPDMILVTATRLSAPHFTKKEVPPTREQLKALPVFEKSFPILQSFLFRLLDQRMSLEETESQLYVGTVERWFMNARDWMSSAAEAPAERGGSAPKPVPSQRVRAGADSVSDATILERIAAVGSGLGIPVVMVRLEIDPRDPTAAERELARASRELGIHYLDTRAAFRGTRASDYWIHPLDPHPNAAAHEIFAREIASFFASEGLLSPIRGQ